ncbi:uncharacterized protein LOC131668257 [Phymastichus coffea]|uniref:uncharacterized protein LOC131668257 n=1 Tax=Phymastichus coffea TaxID=108790 RepID=UPI00273B2DCA|nr:uncharacterized protein LOC131668257 [Phymastichus coffea]
MEASKQENISRQSSILKAPKQRQPLQTVATNPSSSESSPTIKIKRRVSFAKNKRIREFCNEVEPKEGLDDSYEEHDLSSTKSSNGNSTDQPLVISVACEDKENFPIQLFLPTDQFECKEIMPVPCSAKGDFSQYEIDMDHSINTLEFINAEIQNQEMSNATIYFDDGMDITASIQPQIISAHIEEEACYNDTVPVSKTCIEDIPMEMTENVQSILSKKLVPNQSKNRNNSLNSTETCSAILGIGHVKKLLESQHTKPFAKSCENETECFTDVPLEFTSIIPSSTWIRPFNQSQGGDETERFNCKTMEFTEVAQLHNIMSNNKAEEILNTSDKVKKVLLADENSKISNMLLKQTQHKEVCQEKNNILCNSSTVINDASSNQKMINQSGNVNCNLLEIRPETTNFFNNASMEITEAVPVFNEIKILNRSSIEEEIPQEKTKFSIDASMEMTEIITSQNKIDQHTSLKNKELELDTNKTKLFSNISMDMTEAIPNCQKIDHPIEIIPKSHQGNIHDNTKIFINNSMEMTEALGLNEIQKLNNRKNQLMISEKEKNPFFEIAGKIQPGNIPDKTKFFNNNSMEMTEALGVNEIQRLNYCKNQLTVLEQENARFFDITGKTKLGSVSNKSKFFNDNPMEMTEVLGFNDIPKLNHCKRQLSAPESEKTQIFFNTSMEITEAAPMSNKINKSILTVNKTHHETIQNKTKLSNDKSIEVTNCVLHNTEISPVDKLDNNQLCEPREEKTKLFFNTSMEITDSAAELLNKINQPTENKQITIHNEDVALQNTELLHNKSMEITEAVPVYDIHLCTSDKGTIQKEFIEDRNKIFQNTSIEVTEAVHNYNKSDLLCNSKNQLAELEQEQTKLFFNSSIDIAEAAPVISRAHQIGSELKSTLSKNIRDEIDNFQNKSMEMTEPVKNLCSKNYHFEQSMSKSQIDDKLQEKSNKFPNMSIMETISLNREISQCNTKNSTDILKHKNLGIETINSDNKTTDKTKYFNKSMDFTEILPVINHQSMSRYVQNEAANVITDKTKHFYNNSMDITEAAMQNQNSISANPSTLAKSLKNSERLHQYDRSLCNDTNVPNPNHLDNKKDSVFNRSSYRDKSFQRITTDELHTLCASMNLPTQNYTAERNTTLQNDYISICNDVNVLRDSLQKNSIFQQNFTIGSSISVAVDNNIQISTNVNGSTNKQDDLQIFCNKNCNSDEKREITSKEELDNLVAGSEKEYNNSEKDVSREKNLRVFEIKSIELNRINRNSQDQNVSGVSNKSMTIGNHTEYSESNILNEKQTCGIESNIHCLNKSEIVQIHNNTSPTFSNTQKSSIKRKSSEMDEHFEIVENSLKRLPSDNTDFLIATMGIRTELSHPLIINHKTTIKVPCTPLENNSHGLSFSSDESIRLEENISRGEHEKSSKNKTTSIIENEVFNDDRSYLDKENNISENKECLEKFESFSENFIMNELDEIQPPSFLCSDSFQTDSIVDAEVPNNKSSDAIPSDIIQEQINITFENQFCTVNSNSCNSKNSSTRETKQSLEKDFLPSISTHTVGLATIFHKENSETVDKLESFNSSKHVNDSEISLINEEDVNIDPLAPFIELTKSIEIYERRDDCIWTIRKIDQKTVAVNFISESFVTIIRLNEIEKACIKDIDNIEFISRLHSDTKNILLKIVHCLLLSKLKTDKLLSQYKMYEDVLPLLDFISNEVILTMNFMFDLERLSSLNLLNVESERVLFMVSSKKGNIILEISLMLKVFNEIGPDDISVTCVLGDVRISDIKQLIVNIRKDSSFLSRYIKDVKDYIMLMEESTHVLR